jgi:glycosyltransferase involved in cell wall biosynthesis
MNADVDGVITVFPQLAAMTGAQKRFGRRKMPIVSWFFDTELSAVRLWCARQFLADVDCFVVHTNVERTLFPALLKLPQERFRFAHLQYGGAIATDPEDEQDPFVFATGSGFRDYGTFFAAMAKLGYPTKVLAGPRILAGLDIPSNVEVLSDMPKSQIHSHVRRARVNAVPLTNEGITAGGVTIVETFRHGRPLAISQRDGLADYLEDDVNCLIAERHNVDALAEVIEAMWDDPGLRERLGKGAESFAEAHCTDGAAALTLRSILDEFG